MSQAWLPIEAIDQISWSRGDTALSDVPPNYVGRLAITLTVLRAVEAAAKTGLFVGEELGSARRILSGFRSWRSKRKLHARTEQAFAKVKKDAESKWLIEEGLRRERSRQFAWWWRAIAHIEDKGEAARRCLELFQETQSRLDVLALSKADTIASTDTLEKVVTYHLKLLGGVETSEGGEFAD
jgi:hypothetical protein